MNKLERIQRSFAYKIEVIQHLNYWEQLKKLNLYSLERRRERYIAIYVWKIVEGRCPNISDTHGISSHWNERRGRSCRVPSISNSATCRVKSIRFNSFAVKGPRIFNSLPMDIRNFTGGTVDQFKRRLDRHLRSVPDEPLIPGYTALRTIDSNRLIDWHSHMARNQRVIRDDNSCLRSTMVDLPGSP